jgi:hypothetical protein
MCPMPDDLRRTLEDLLESGTLSQEDVRSIMQAANDPETLERILDTLKQAGADQVGSGPPLTIEDYYRDGQEMFELRWPLQASLPFSFVQLDRKTQFFVLFQEWTRRELEGMTALNSGQVDQARAIFEECLARAQQLQVGELVARSYEGLMRDAQKRSDRTAERHWSELAMKARADNG